MSVLSRNRKESGFEVFHHWYQVRKEVTDILLVDFGYSREKAEKQIKRGQAQEPTEIQQDRYQKMEERLYHIDEWFIEYERKCIVDCIRMVQRYMYLANDIMPQYKKELEQRRTYQDIAIGYCDDLKQELQYIIETLPVDINKYTGIVKMIDREISLIKGWRKSDNRFKKTVKS